ncbi:MAG: 50S ribosomal protein L9 [Alphaproteobacteria bacterium MarineAlpha9_Bin4]|nr:50S ribosomal protein L9 [Pelagibacterales bacterium]PPR25685.1 MAG: 50S ribosomal protein L9 [Alphaproteobacteria bacterium MarineAlpha9_Bin4]|tara:strand:- start:44 stop:493 length:450 start_codon:yes stop_codon:yes gene_type:complete
MEVILLEKVNKLGDIGQTVNVKSGYARNFLFPNKIAIQATKENKEIFEKQKEQLNKANKEKIKIAEQLMTKVPDSIKIYREASEQGALFGSVTSRDVVNEFNNSKKLNLKAKDFIIKQVIKNLGEYTGTLVLHPEVTKNIQIQVQTIEK